MKLPLRSKKDHWPMGISDVARRLEISATMVRTYEAQGVVKIGRDSAGRRLYLPEDVEKLRLHLAALAMNKKRLSAYRTELHRAAVEAD